MKLIYIGLIIHPLNFATRVWFTLNYLFYILNRISLPWPKWYPLTKEWFKYYTACSVWPVLSHNIIHSKQQSLGFIHSHYFKKLSGASRLPISTYLKLSTFIKFHFVGIYLPSFFHLFLSELSKTCLLPPWPIFFRAEFLHVCQRFKAMTRWELKFTQSFIISAYAVH